MALFEVDQVALTLLQVDALLFPVVILTIRWIVEYETEALSEETVERSAYVFYVLILALTFIGFASSLSIIVGPFRTLLIELSVIALSIFFGAYGYLMYILGFG